MVPVFYRTASRLILIALLAGIGVSSVRAQTIEAVRNVPVEITLQSSVSYAHPIRDIDVRVVFSGPNQARIEQAAFWDGGENYTIRFSPPTTGVWTYCTEASDAGNAGLHGRCGEISVEPYSGENPFQLYGWPNISDDGRYFIYDDGTPFFLLVDAILEVTWKSTIEQIDTYIADRKTKGFTTAWIVPMSHQYFYPHGVRNRYGEEYFIDGDKTLLNPDYFDYLDAIVNRVNDAGMIVLLNPIWGRMATVYGDPLRERAINKETALLHARYIGGRYAANNVIWLIAGDTTYETMEAQEYWRAFAERLDSASGDRHLITAHATGYHGSYLFFNQEQWLDFHTYTGAHLIDGEFHWQGSMQSRVMEPPRPTLNIEFNFEDIYDRFWLFWGDTTNAVRMTSEDVRRAAYQSILSGGNAGSSYGGNGLWQWTTPETIEGFGVRYTALEALSLEGSTHMSILKTLMERYKWYTLNQFDGLIADTVAQRQVVFAANSKYVLGYLPRHTVSVTLSTDFFLGGTEYAWINPRTGSTVLQAPLPSSKGTRLLSFEPPDEEDWLMVIGKTASGLDVDPDENPDMGLDLLQVRHYPSPSSGETTFELASPGAGTLLLEMFDVTGRKVQSRQWSVSSGRVKVPVSLPARGVLLYRVTITTPSGTYSGTGSLVSI